MAFRTPAQLANRRRIESVLVIVAPALDLLLAAGDRISRVAGRDEIDPDPPRRSLRAESPPAPGYDSAVRGARGT